MALVVTGWALAAVPTVLLVACMVAGRYVAEDRLLALARRRPPSRRPRLRAVALSRSAVVAVRGGALLARSLAKRPPPALLSR